MATSARRLEIGTLEGWLWDAACQIRGAMDAPKLKDFILPLVFLKRLSDVFEDEVARLGAELGSEEIARQIVDGDHSMVRLYLPPTASWMRCLPCSALEAGVLEVEERQEQRNVLPRQESRETGLGSLPNDWQVARFDSMVDIAQGQVDPRQEPYRSLVNVGPENIEEGTGKLTALRTAADLGLISGKYYFASDHVLYSKIRPYLRKAALADFTGLCSADVYAQEATSRPGAPQFFNLATMTPELLAWTGHQPTLDSSADPFQGQGSSDSDVAMPKKQPPWLWA